MQDHTPAPGSAAKTAAVLTPTRVIRAVEKRLRDVVQPLNGFRGVYASFAEAERATPAVRPLGYDCAGSAEWYPQKFNSVQFGDYPVLFWLREAFSDSRTVLEIGGHMGQAFYGFAGVMDYPPGLVWTVLDVPSIVAAGTALAAKKGRSEIRFVSTLEHSPGAEILLSTGALQYLETDLSISVAAFPIRPRHVLINFIPVYDGAAFITVQNIGTAYCPYRVFNRKEFVNSLERLGYDLVASWKRPRNFRIPLHRDKSFDVYSGFYFRLRSVESPHNG